MSRIKINNFGPIREGFTENEGWMNINKVTVFTGDQGSGKSTVAKLISLFFWIEKNIVRNTISADQLNVNIFKNLCNQQEIFEYFSEDTFISFEGDAFNFIYDNKTLSFKATANNGCKNYILPKIQYVSAARNLLTILYNISGQIIDKDNNIVDLSSNIPFMVRVLNIEYRKALEVFAKNGFSLPINDTNVYYQNHNTFITTKGKRISMSAASSGIQSITPLLIVSHYLMNEVRNDIYEKVQTLDNNLKKKIENDFAKENANLLEKFTQVCLFGKGILKNKEDEFLLDEKLKKYIPSSFINIVEEPEQNLFPISQQKVINTLLEYNNAKRENKLIISTHSPYILSTLNNSILAEDVFNKTGKEINDYGQRKRVDFTDVSAFKFSDGKIFNIKDEETRLINADEIDSCSEKINSDFGELLDLLPENETNDEYSE